MTQKRKRGGAHYDEKGNLLTVRKPSTDPAVQMRASVPKSLAQSLNRHCQRNGVKQSKIIQRLIKEYLDE